MEKLTPRQQQVFDLIISCIDRTGMPPTRAEIAQTLGFKSANAAEEHLRALHRKGAIEMLKGTSRGIRVLWQAENQDNFDDQLPVVGQVAAGEPILAQQHIEQYCQVDPDLFRPRADYLLRVNGMSMKDIGIFDGDLLAVHRQETASNGQVIVARVDDDVTVKRLQRNGSKVLLLAENEDFAPIEVDLGGQQFAIEGLAVGVIRQGGW